MGERTIDQENEKTLNEQNQDEYEKKYQRKQTNNCTMNVLNISKGTLVSKNPNPVNDSLDNIARDRRSLSGNRRPAKEKDNRRGKRKLLTKDLRQ